MAVSTLEDVAHFRQGRLPPTWGARLDELARKLEARGGSVVFQLGHDGDAMGDSERASKLRADVAAGRVIANDGRVALRRSSIGTCDFLEFQGNAGPVFWSQTGYPMPIPGVWRVYLLPTSRVAVGAEGWGSPASEPGRPTIEHITQYRAAVLSSQSLDEGALLELRAGRLPAVVVSQARQSAMIMGAIALGLAGLALSLGLGVAAMWLLSASARFSPALGPLLLVAMVALLALAALMARSARRQLDVERESVVVDEGAPTLTTTEHHANGRRHMTYRLELAQRAFSNNTSQVVHRVFHVLAQGFPLRCYSTSVTGQLLAIEPVIGPH